MQSVLRKMSKEKLKALATIVTIHDPNDSDDGFNDLTKGGMIKAITKELSSAGGHTVVNIFRGGGVPYKEIVRDVANHISLDLPEKISVPEAETQIIQQYLKQVLAKLNDKQRGELAAFLEKVAADEGKSFAKEGGVLIALTAAKLSGFSLYLAASTAVGAITGGLGIALPFAFYTTMSSTIAVVIGPVGWAALGLAAVYKLGAPNMKKLLPAVMFIALERNSEPNARI